MTEIQVCIVRVLLVVSVLFCLIPAVCAFVKLICKYKKKEKVVFAQPLSRKLMILSVFLVGSVWALRFAALYFYETSGDGNGFNCFEMIFYSLIHSLQTVSMDEDYDLFIALGREMIKTVISEDVRVMQVYGLYSSFLNFLTPVAGGVIIFDVLTSFFPRLRLSVSIFRKHYYFSELNERTLALAKSILSQKHSICNKPLLVFTDTYLDDESEKSSEMFLQARKLGAVCISDELSHLNVRCLREKQFFLMDEKEGDNIKTLSAMCENKSKSMLKKSQLYIFYQDDSYAMIEKRIYDKINKIFSDKDAPVIVRVKEYENLVLGLLAEKPLIASLVGREYNPGDKNEYNLTIIGSGKIGMQMFLSSTWAGQFYGYKLNINVVSEESWLTFRNRLNRLGSEILESTKPNTELLKIYQDKQNREFAEPYFKLRYGEYNLNDADLTDIVCTAKNDADENDGFLQDKFNILNSDYFVVALGSDELNIFVAEELERKISITQNPEEKKHQVISYVVYNNDFCSILSSGDGSSESGITMYPFGSVEETYSYENVTMINNDQAGLSVKKMYDKASVEKVREEQLKRINKSMYDSLSSKARDVHLKYRIFSALLYLKVNGSEKDKRNAVNDLDENVYLNDVLSGKAGEDVLQYLTWLEHRRWNAYTRSIGFVYCDMKDKDIRKKIHGCLVECSDKPIDGNSKIRTDDLKLRLTELIATHKELDKGKIDGCVDSWKRLPESELIQTEKLKDKLNSVLNDLLALNKQCLDIDEEKSNCIKKLHKIKDDVQRENLINHTENPYYSLKIDNQNKRIKAIIDSCVDSSKKVKEGESVAERMPDKLDRISEWKKLDIKYYDFPKKTDTELINEVIKARKEGN